MTKKYSLYKLKILIYNLVLFAMFFSCREDYDYVNYGAQTQGLQEPQDIGIRGLYVLNEGNMGANKASLDFFSYETGLFIKNYYNQQNPNIPGSMGNVGNDLKIYRNKMFAVINLSNYVEVMEASTAKHIGEIKIVNCRYLNFHGDYVYISSYGGAVGQSTKGHVYKVDVESLQIVDKVEVGLQPDELEIVGDYLYVANSGGYSPPNYDDTVSVIDLKSFKEIKKIPVAINLHRIKKDDNGKLWVSSRGNYMNIGSKIYVLNPQTHLVEKELDVPISDFSIIDNRLYYLAYVWSPSGPSASYGIIDTDTKEKIQEDFISKEIQNEIVTPYGITVNPMNGDIFIADAKDYVSPGELFCFTKYGKIKWRTTTGDIPGHFAWLYK